MLIAIEISVNKIINQILQYRWVYVMSKSCYNVYKTGCFLTMTKWMAFFFSALVSNDALIYVLHIRQHFC